MIGTAVRRLFALGVVLVVALAGALLGVTPAAADTEPPVPNTPATVSSDPLPTVQINGVVWAQVLVGNTVYVDRQVHQRPPGRGGRRARMRRRARTSWPTTSRPAR